MSEQPLNTFLILVIWLLREIIEVIIQQCKTGSGFKQNRSQVYTKDPPLKFFFATIKTFKVLAHILNYSMYDI